MLRATHTHTCGATRGLVGATTGERQARPEDMERRGTGFVTTAGVDVTGHGGTRSSSLRNASPVTSFVNLSRPL